MSFKSHICFCVSFSFIVFRLGFIPGILARLNLIFFTLILFSISCSFLRFTFLFNSCPRFLVHVSLYVFLFKSLLDLPSNYHLSDSLILVLCLFVLFWLSFSSLLYVFQLDSHFSLPNKFLLSHFPFFLSLFSGSIIVLWPLVNSFFVFLPNTNLCLAQSAGAVEYTDCTSAEG